jgi:hypothetical protein
MPETKLRTFALILSLATLVLLAVIHFTAERFFLYWHFVWLDLVSHFLGGVVVGFGALWLALGIALKRKTTLTPQDSFIFVALCFLVVAVSWELYEYHFKLFEPLHPYNYSLDTTLDILVGLLGAWCARSFLFASWLVRGA